MTADADAGTVTGDKRVSWAELFFDLVFVFAVTEVSTLIGRDHSSSGLLRALIVFVPVYWMWVGAAIQTNQNDLGRPLVRLRIFAVALSAVFMALALPTAYGRLGTMFAVAYWAGRILCGALILRRPRDLIHLNPLSMSMVITGPMILVGSFFHGSVRELIWGLAALIDLSTPSLFRSRLRDMHIDAAHLAERFGAFVLIAIGEAVVAIGSSVRTDDLNVADCFAVAAAFVLSCGLWWVYFHFAADAVRHSLETAKVQMDITRLVLSYGHLSFIAAIILVSVGMRAAVADPGAHLAIGNSGLMFGGAALYLATFGFTRWAMFRLVSYTRLTTAAVVLALMPIAPHVPALVALVALAIVVASLNIVELIRVGHPGWRARSIRRRPLSG